MGVKAGRPIHSRPGFAQHNYRCGEIMAIAVVAFFGLILVLLLVMIIRDMASPFYLLVALTPISLTLPQGLPFREVPAIMRCFYLVAVMIACKLHRRSVWKLFAGDTLSKLMLLWGAVIVAAFVHSGDYTSWAERTLIRMLSYIAPFCRCRQCNTDRQEQVHKARKSIGTHWKK